MSDKIEFHLQGGGVLSIVESSHAPDRGDLVNIRSQNYRVIGRTYTVDYSDKPHLTEVACIINLERAEP